MPCDAGHHAVNRTDGVCDCGELVSMDRVQAAYMRGWNDRGDVDAEVCHLIDIDDTFDCGRYAAKDIQEVAANPELAIKQWEAFKRSTT